MIRAFILFYFTRTLANWRALRRACMAALPKVDKGGAEREML